MGPIFKDRMEAGRKMAGALQRFEDRNPIVLGMARGGVVLAAAIAEELHAPLDVLVVRKIGAPGNPEFGVGAVAPQGISVFDDYAMKSLYLRPADLQRSVNQELAEVERRLDLYRSGQAPLDLKGHTAILVDDGLATGITAVAAARYARHLGASYTVFAAPVCSRPGSVLLDPEVDEVLCLETPAMFYAVGMWYEDFSQVEDEQVLQILAMARTKGYAA